MNGPTNDLFNLREHWPWLLVLALTAMMFSALAPILTPFVVGAVFAYLGDPIADALERRRLNRTAAVVVVFTVLTLAVVLLVAIIAPLLQEQLTSLVRGLPAAVDWVQDVALPKIGIRIPDKLKLNGPFVQKWIGAHWQEAGSAAGVVAQSGLALLGTLANIAMVPVVSFYLLRDWDLLVAWFDGVTPPRYQPLVRRLAAECDDVLGSFVRGQLLVMAALAGYYALALWLAGLNLALLVALVAGLLSFVPYLGFATGFATALIAMLMQQPELTPLLWIVGIFVLGQLLEGNVLTPLLVGEKIGLHPVAVIFAVMAGGQLLGFSGVLIALPCAAVLAVGLREIHRRWMLSKLYRHTAESPANSQAVHQAGAAVTTDEPPGA